MNAEQSEWNPVDKMLPSFEAVFCLNKFELEAFIDSGQAGQIRELISKRVTSIGTEGFDQVIGRSWAASVIFYLRRLGLGNLALRVYGSWIDRHRKRQIVLTAEEVFEYAGTLAYLGFNSEAQNLFRDYTYENKSNYPLAYLYQAFGKISQWDYEEAIPLIQEFLKFQSPSEKYFWVGKLNLSAALIFMDQFEDALFLLREVENYCQSKKSSLLLLSVLELKIECYFNLNMLPQCLDLIQQAQKYILSSARPEELFIEKWKSLVNLKLNSQRSKMSNKTLFIESALEKAICWPHFETIRDIFFHHALCSEATSSFSCDLIFGTPYKSLRKKYANQFHLQSVSYQAKELYLSKDKYKLFTGARDGQNINSPNDLIGEFSFLDVKDLGGKVLRTLFSDFFKPWTIERLHNELYPESYFNSDSSPHRVNQALYHARNYLAKTKIPIQIKNKGHYIEVNFNGFLKICDIGLEFGSLDNIAFDRLPARLGAFYKLMRELQEKTGQEFGITDLMELSGLSRRTVMYHLSELKKLNLVDSVNVNGSRYKHFLFAR